MPPPSNIDQILPTLLKEATFSDITFKTNGAEIKAHKCVVAVRFAQSFLISDCTDVKT